MGRSNYPVPNLGQRIYSWRYLRKFTLEDLAQLTGLNRGALSRIENEETPDPSFGVIVKIAAALGVSLDELAGHQTHGVDHPYRRFEVDGRRTTAQKRKVDAVDQPYTHILVTRHKTTARKRKAG